MLCKVFIFVVLLEPWTCHQNLFPIFLHLLRDTFWFFLSIIGFLFRVFYFDQFVIQSAEHFSHISRSTSTNWLSLSSTCRFDVTNFAHSFSVMMLNHFFSISLWISIMKDLRLSIRYSAFSTAVNFECWSIVSIYIQSSNVITLCENNSLCSVKQIVYSFRLW